MQTQIEISFRLGYIEETEFNTFFANTREVERMLSSLIGKVKESR